MNPVPSLSPWAVLTATAALLAFLVGVHTLLGQQRKTPYLINSVFSVFFICLIGALFDIAAVLIPQWHDALLKLGVAFLLIAAAVTLWRMWTIWIRLTQFVDPGLWSRFRTLFVVRFLKNIFRRLKGGHTYEHDPAHLDEELSKQIESIVRGASPCDKTCVSPADEEPQVHDAIEKRSLCMALRHQGQANDIVGRIAETFLKNGHCVQYMTASRHPIEFMSHLRTLWSSSGSDWQAAKDKIVVVDAYTPHFGFTDSIYAVKTTKLRDHFGVECLSSPPTYAGLHSASRKAFNVVKKKSKDSVRQPALVVYEDTYALSDIESVEQYRIFVRHVLPSERLWDGMFTVFTETAQPDADWELLSSYASLAVDYRRPCTAKSDPEASA